MRVRLIPDPHRGHPMHRTPSRHLLALLAALAPMGCSALLSFDYRLAPADAGLVDAGDARDDLAAPDVLAPSDATVVADDGAEDTADALAADAPVADALAADALPDVAPTGDARRPDASSDDVACGRGLTRCSAHCVDLRTDDAHCGTCGVRCVDLAADPNHCRSCGRACAPGARCQGGSCCGVSGVACCASGTPCQDGRACESGVCV